MSIKYLDGLRDAIDRRPYDCTCQVGGVDAMSIDTDWLSTIQREARKALVLAEADRDVAEARIRAVRALLGHLDPHAARLIREALDGEA